MHLYVYTVYIRYYRQGNHHTYGHIQCVYTVLANPRHMGSPSTCLIADGTVNEVVAAILRHTGMCENVIEPCPFLFVQLCKYAPQNVM